MVMLGQVLDLGCGEARLLTFLRADPRLTLLEGVDADAAVLTRAQSRIAPLWTDQLQPRARPLRVRLWHGSVAAPDIRWRGVPLAACLEVYAANVTPC
jgi:hypothetical protein